MADTPLYKGGTPLINYGPWTGDTPVLYGPPFGHRHKPFTPPYDSHYEAEMGGKASFAAGYPLVPSKLEWQQINIRAARPEVGDVIQMIIVPCNHYIQSVRLDVTERDKAMAGATVSVAGQWIRRDPAKPDVFLTTPCLEIEDALTAQGITPVSLSVPSSTVVWLTRTGGPVTGTVTGTADTVTGAITATAAVDTSGYAVPLYVAPQIIVSGNPPDEVYSWHQGGALLLGIRLETTPTSGAGLDSMLGGIYLSTRIDGYECPAFV
jgi:hypothetical protein